MVSLIQNLLAWSAIRTPATISREICLLHHDMERILVRRVLNNMKKRKMPVPQLYRHQAGASSVVRESGRDSFPCRNRRLLRISGSLLHHSAGDAGWDFPCRILQKQSLIRLSLIRPEAEAWGVYCLAPFWHRCSRWHEVLRAGVPCRSACRFRGRCRRFCFRYVPARLPAKR